MKKRYTKYWIDQYDIKVKCVQKNLINYVSEVLYDNSLSSEIICKWFKKAGVTLALDESEYETFIYHNQLLKDEQLMADQTE